MQMIFFEKDEIMNVFFDLSQAKNPQKKKNPFFVLSW